MKKIFAFAALCAAVLVSCTQKEIAVDTPVEEQSDVKLIPITITANFEGVKSDMVDAAWTWKSGDKLAVYDGTEKREFTLDDSSAGKDVAKFTGEVAENFTELKAVFPFDKAGDSFGTPTIPAEQAVIDGTIDPMAMIATSDRAEKVSDDEYNFYFTSGVSLLRFTPPAGATKVILHAATKGETLAGDSPSVTVDLGKAAADGTKRFWAAVNPAKLSGIHVFTLKNDGKYYRLGTEKEIDLSTPGKGKNLGSLAAGTEVAVIETGGQLATYLNSTPALDAYIVKDLDLTNQSITPCASYAKTFDGLWHSIGNWTSEGVALFKANTGTVKCFSLAQSCVLKLPETLSAGDYAFVVANNQGKVDSIVNYADVIEWTGDITGAFNFGTIIGHGPEQSIVTDCENHGNIIIHANEHAGVGTSAIGGVCGRLTKNTSKAIGCKNEGEIQINTGITASGANIYCAGVIGCTTYTVTASGCSNTKDISIHLTETKSAIILAGVSSYTSGPLSDCTNTGNISITSDNYVQAVALGGVCAYSSNSVQNCSNSGSISLSAKYFNGGNAIGSIKDDASSSKTTGALAIGGLIGYTYQNFSMSNCNNEGSVSLDITSQNLKTAIGSAYRFEVGGLVADAWGDITESHNTGNLSASLKSETGEFLPVKPSDPSAASGGGTMYVGGIAGSNYESLTQSNLNISNCTNTGCITVHSDSKSTTNNAIGGIVGWPGKEADCSSITSGCINGSVSDSSKGIITVSGNITYRTGGIQGGSGNIQECTNYGKIHAKSGKAAIGGLAGYHGGSYSLSDSKNFGPVQSDIKATGIGGLIGVTQKLAQEYGEGCSVNCSITSSKSTEKGLIIGHFGGNTETIVIATEAKPIRVKGSVDGIEVTSDTYINYLFGPAKYDSSMHSVYSVYGE